MIEVRVDEVKAGPMPEWSEVREWLLWGRVEMPFGT